MSREVINDLTRALRAPEVSITLPRAILELGFAEDEETVKQSLQRMVCDTTVLKEFDDPQEFNFKDVDALYAESVRESSPTYVVDALNYVRLYQALAKQMRTLDLDGEKWFGASMPHHAAAGLIAAVDAVEGFDATLLSSKLVLGKLYALQSRDAASRLFSSAHAELHDQFDVFPHEGGADTYLDASTLERNEEVIAERRESLPERREYGSVCLDNARFFIFMSCERKFLRIYMPYWLSVAEYLKARGFAFHVLLTDATDEADDIVESAAVLLRALAVFRGYDPTTFCDNVSFSSVPVPPWCPDRRSYSACARFLYARELSERTGARVIVQDIDFFVSHDPVPWYEALPPDRLSLGSYGVKLTVDPWMKFSAGIYVLPHEASAFALMQRMEDYLLKGLGKPVSWYLDQNAIAYLYEVGTSDYGDDLLFNLDRLRPGLPLPRAVWRPVHGLPIHGVFESSQP
jgi:hypothetical protein